MTPPCFKKRLHLWQQRRILYPSIFHCKGSPTRRQRDRRTGERLRSPSQNALCALQLKRRCGCRLGLVVSGGRSVARDGRKDALAAKATLQMKPISPATPVSLLARRIPKGRHQRFTVHGPRANIIGWGLPWARDVLEGPHCAKAALWVDAVRLAPEATDILATRVPEVGNRGLVGKLADLRGRTIDFCVVASTAEPASDILPVGITTELAFVATWLPIIRDAWLIVESTTCGVRLGCALWTIDANARRVAAEPALSMDTVCPTAQVTCDTVLIPIVRDEGFVLEVAAASWAIDVCVVACAAVSALDVLGVRLATQLANLASWIPEVAHAYWLVLELARPFLRGRLCVRGQGLETQCDDGGFDTVHIQDDGLG